MPGALPIATSVPGHAADGATSGGRRRAAPLPPEARRAAIIDAVLPLLVEQGAAATSRQLAQAAGVSEGTIFNVFGDKEALLAAVVQTAIDPGPFERAIAGIDPSAPLEQRLAEAVTLIQRRVADVWRLLSQLGPQHRPSPPRSLPESPALTRLLSVDPTQLRLPPAEAARLLRSLTLACTHPLLSPRPRPPAEIVDLFLHGAAGCPAPTSTSTSSASHRRSPR